jgi:hypothetical protein
MEQGEGGEHYNNEREMPTTPNDQSIPIRNDYDPRALKPWVKWATVVLILAILAIALWIIVTQVGQGAEPQPVAQPATVQTKAVEPPAPPAQAPAVVPTPVGDTAVVPPTPMDSVIFTTEFLVSARQEQQTLGGLTLEVGDSIIVSADTARRWNWIYDRDTLKFNARPEDRNVTAAGGAHNPADLDVVKKGQRQLTDFFSSTAPLGALLMWAGSDSAIATGMNAHYVARSPGTVQFAINRERQTGYYSEGAMPIQITVIRKFTRIPSATVAP